MKGKEGLFSKIGQSIKNIGLNRKLVNQRLDSIEKLVQDLENNQLNRPPIVIERIYVDKIEVEKFDLNNNIGALGVRELGGTLNIGANYGVGSSMSKDKVEEIKKEKEKIRKESSPKDHHALTVNIKPKK